MRIKPLPSTDWDLNLYNEDEYAHGYVDIYVESPDVELCERVLCLFRVKDMSKYDDDSCTDTTLAILCNSCGINSGITQLVGLYAGQILPVQFDGEYTPRVPQEWINAQFWLSH